MLRIFEQSTYAQSENKKSEKAREYADAIVKYINDNLNTSDKLRSFLEENYNQCSLENKFVRIQLKVELITFIRANIEDLAFTLSIANKGNTVITHQLSYLEKYFDVITNEDCKTILDLFTPYKQELREESRNRFGSISYE